MLPLKLPSSDARPLRYRPDGVGAWSGHIPFAFDLVAAARPGVLVELGTHYGESYFAFCQGIVESGVICSAFAVDTWQGDAHTGSYGDEVFDEVDAHNRSHFDSFSHLLRMTFDEAAQRFDAETIGILHLDGLHTYEAVRRDFETWIGKVAPGGIVLLHDTAVRRGDFGAWRFWDELQERFPTFAFDHSNGLGVLVKPGPMPGGGILGLMFGNREFPACAIRTYYEMCAERLLYRNRDGQQSFTIQLFWRSAADPFSEARSVTRLVNGGPKALRVRLSIPPLNPPPAQLRLDFTDRAGFLRVSSARLLSKTGEEVWNLGAELARENRLMAEMQIAGGTDGIWVLARGNDPSLVLSASPDALTLLSDGGMLAIEMAAVKPLDQLWSIVDGSIAIQAKEIASPPPPSGTPFARAQNQAPMWRGDDGTQIVGGDANVSAPLYLDLLKKCLTRTLFPDSSVNLEFQPTGRFDPDARREGKDWPSEADTMIGILRLENIERCAVRVLREDIPGDFVETGVWRGGASIFLRAVLKALNDERRQVWVVDSFEGLPEPDPERYPADRGDVLSQYNAYLGVPIDRVKANFAKYGLLDGQVRFLPGWFKNSLPSAPIERISLLRLDGDMYESTMDVLNNLYWKISPGGFVIVDDYGALANCKAAIHDFRNSHGITEEIVPVDWTGVYWRRRK